MKEEIKTRKKTKNILEYYADCLVCGKQIRGYSEGQVNFNLIIHKQSKECKQNDK